MPAVGPSNGSRLSCGRGLRQHNGCWTKSRARQGTTQWLPLNDSARQLQALVRQPQDRDERYHRGSLRASEGARRWSQGPSMCTDPISSTATPRTSKKAGPQSRASCATKNAATAANWIPFRQRKIARPSRWDRRSCLARSPTRSVCAIGLSCNWRSWLPNGSRLSCGPLGPLGTTVAER